MTAATSKRLKCSGMFAVAATLAVGLGILKDQAIAAEAVQVLIPTSAAEVTRACELVEGLAAHLA